ncbi:hypothetical protein BROUX41_003813 [Berkeleyomyces rouxiae]|uniref:uncharacterized protein n=1 Tax=Berkeleyomyces rouxiae TaxID=2035830 RepID=UPI003B76454B
MQDQSRTKGPRACTTCAKAKARCIPGLPGAARCQRCHRLNKSCESQEPAPPRPKKAPKPTRVSELERRLNDLTAKLQATQNAVVAAGSHSPGSPSSSSPSLAALESKGASNETHDDLPHKRQRNLGEAIQREHHFSHIFPSDDIVLPSAETSSVSPRSTRAVPRSPSMGSPAPSVSAPSLSASFSKTTPLSSLSVSAPASGPTSTATTAAATTTTTTPAPTSAATSSQSAWPISTSQEAADLLADFRANRQPLFPFVIVPPTMDAAELARTRPLLYRAVMMVTLFYEGPRQMAAMQDLMEALVAASFLGKPQRSLDLLQALQLVIAWTQFDLNGFQTTNMIFLARSISGSMAPKGAVHTATDSRTLEHLRAFAGVYYINTFVFTTNKRPDAFMDTAAVDSWCSAIELQNELPSDELLVQLIRIQRLAHTISVTVVSSNIDSFGSGVPPAPLGMVLHGFQQQLQDFKAGLPPHLRTANRPATVNSHIAIAEALLYEVALSDHISAQLLPAQRIQLLWNCSTAIKSFMSYRFPADRDSPNSPHEPPTTICLSSYDFTFAILTSLKLLLLRVPGWNRLQVAKHLGLGPAIDMQVREMEFVIASRSMRHRQQQQLQKQLQAQLPGSQFVGAAGWGTGVPDPLKRLMLSLKNLRGMLDKEMAQIVHEAEAADMVGVESAAQRPGAGPDAGFIQAVPSLGPPLMSNLATYQQQQHQHHQQQHQQQGQPVPGASHMMMGDDTPMSVSVSGAPPAPIMPVDMSLHGFDPIFNDIETSLWGQFPEDAMWTA